jgi:hypothetical protein
VFGRVEQQPKDGGGQPSPAYSSRFVERVGARRPQLLEGPLQHPLKLVEELRQRRAALDYSSLGGQRGLLGWREGLAPGIGEEAVEATG